jgi:UPF0716 family protein affecting phage T7 exclusion
LLRHYYRPKYASFNVFFVLLTKAGVTLALRQGGLSRTLGAWRGIKNGANPAHEIGWSHSLVIHGRVIVS